MAEFTINKEQIIDILVSHNGYRAEDIQDVSLSKPPLAGDNYASVVVAVKVQLTSGKEVKLFAKTQVQNEQHAKEFEGFDGFINEGAYFAGLVPMFKERFRSQFDAGDFNFDFQPRFLYADEQLVILEDLKARGYAMSDKTVRHKEDVFRPVFDSLARMHAISYVFIQQEGSVKTILDKYPTLEKIMYSRPAAEGLCRPMIDNCVVMTREILEKRLHDGCDEALEVLEKTYPDPYKLAFDLCRDDLSDTKFVAVCHGDVWTCNMMFNEARDHAILIDYQTVHTGNLVRDIGFYMYCSVDASERVGDGWRNCLKIYYELFSHHVGKLGGRVQFSLEEMEQEFIRMSPFFYLWGFGMVVWTQAMGQLTSPDEDGGFSAALKKGMERWLQNEPEKVRKVSQEAVEVIQEFQALK